MGRRKLVRPSVVLSKGERRTGLNKTQAEGIVRNNKE